MADDAEITPPLTPEEVARALHQLALGLRTPENPNGWDSISVDLDAGGIRSADELVAAVLRAREIAEQLPPR